MKVAITGATGFLGRYIVNELLAAGDQCRCWFRPESDRGGFGRGPCEWLSGDLGDPNAAAELVEGTDAIVHSALHHRRGTFRGGEGDLIEFTEKNVIGTLRLIEAAKAAGVHRFVFISTCAVHELILEDRPLDEAHPLWPTTHYGAHKAAIEKFVHSYGLGSGYNICSLRPTGIYGLATPPADSKWIGLVKSVAAGADVATAKGGKEVHARDVARAVQYLLRADCTAGQAYNCCDMYVAEQDVAEIARKLTGSPSRIENLKRSPKHRIDTGKLRALGMNFGGRELLEATVEEMLRAC